MRLPAGKPPPLWLARRAAAALLLAAILSACLAWSTPTPVVQSPHSAPDTANASSVSSPVASLTHPVIPERATEPENALQLLFYLPVEGPFVVGSEAAAIISSTPVTLSRLVGNKGEPMGLSIVPWEVQPFELEQDMCIAWDRPCPEAGNWIRHDGRLVLRRKVDWIGLRLLWVTVRYRYSSGRTIPVYQSATGLVNSAQVSLGIEGKWDRSTPVEALPAPIQTVVVETQLAYPLAGSVLWEDGRCCAGGTAGDTIQVRADFSSSSPHGEVVEMRVRTGSTCFAAGEMEQAAWEPFVLQRSFPFTLAINWVGFYITVQYRDLHGNLSPAFCDNISLEGMPQRTP